MSGPVRNGSGAEFFAPRGPLTGELTPPADKSISHRAAIIGAIAEEHGDRMKVFKMNVDDSPQTPGKYGVRSIPTVMAFKNGQVVQQLVGARPKSAFDEMVSDLL